MRTDSKTLEAIRRAARTPDGRILHSHMAAELEGVKRTLISAPIEQVPRLQGRAAMLEELVALLGGEPSA